VSGDELSRDQQAQWEHELRSARAELAESQVEASAGDGSVRIVMSGTQECLKVLIAPNLLTSQDPELLEQLIRLAINQAIQDSQLMAARRLSPLSGALDR
jgi:hypothetical protein